MGAWGCGSFDNDTALDWLGDLQDGDATLVAEAFDAIIGATEDNYIEVDEACAALAAAELVAAALGKGDERLEEDAASWLKDHRDAVSQIGAARARQVVERVFEKTELRQIWDDSDDAAEWHADVLELLKRLA